VTAKRTVTKAVQVATRQGLLMLILTI